MEKLQKAYIQAKTTHPEINWTEFNFPPCLNLFHFSLSELQPPYKSLVRLLYISYLIIFVESLFNLINAISQAAVGYHAIILLYTFLNILILNPLQMYIFYRGYRGVCAEEGLIKLYKIFHLIVCVLYLVLSIVTFGGINGFTKIRKFSNRGQGGLVFLTVVESILFLGSALFGTFCVFKVHKFEPKSDGL